MPVSVLVLFGILLSVSEVISQCPPSSGFIGIYLIHNGTCYTNGSYFYDASIISTPLECVLPGANLNSGQWIGPNGTVPCDSGNRSNVQCTSGSSGASLSVHVIDTNNDYLLPPGDGWYKCCLPTDCSDPNTNIIFANIFRYAQIASFTADLPSDMTVYPQEYKLNCTKIGFNEYGISMSIGDTTLASYTNCDDDNSSNTCPGTELVSSISNTIRYTVDITWDGVTVSSGSASHSETIGDQMYQCVLDNPSNGDDRTRTLTIKVPIIAPHYLTEVRKTNATITVGWFAFDSSDADGYVVNITSDTGTVQIVQVKGNSNNTITLNGLRELTTYSITVRAYQQLLGPASNAIIIRTLPTVITSNLDAALIVDITGSFVILILFINVMMFIVMQYKVYVKNNELKDDIFTEELLDSFDDDEYEDEQSFTSGTSSSFENGPKPFSYGNPIQNFNRQKYLKKTPSRTAHDDPDFEFPVLTSLPISINDLVNHIAKYSNKFEDQYLRLYTGNDRPCTVGYTDENKYLNRFQQITVYDDNRIILTPNPNLYMCEREYINASYIDGYSSSNKFIATQGPMVNTLADFWRLIWQERPMHIVMLTDPKECIKNKWCEQYWPRALMEEEKFGPFIVTLTNVANHPSFTIRSLNVIIPDGSNDSHTLTQYHLTSWPDHGVPKPLLSLHKQVMATWSPSEGPILVHCSAGVGRTGTFIAIDIALEQADREGVVDIAGIVNRLRQQRMKMVQTLDQYVFLHDAVFSETIIGGETEIPADKFATKLQELKEIDSSTGCSGLQSQFELLSQVTPDLDDATEDNAGEDLAKNQGSNSYTNPSFTAGYHDKKAFIIAQSPMENTARDFWKMIVDYKVSAIVMLCGEEDCCYPYWTGLSTHDDFVVEIANEIKSNGYIERMLNVESRNVLQLQVTDWPQDGVVREPRTVLQVIDDVIHRQQKIGGGPVVVHCSDTVSRSGVYCSVSIGLEQCKAEGVVDVFQVTKAVRKSKPGAVTTLEQYTSIYDVIDMYLQMNKADDDTFQ
ncbi:PREDICTED: receptor-type tyrosine-protein phosphatase kappa-like isoform X1 [Amphimedon queenslandica]|uniref:protein-tyrosine-phosphatase n=1 Tax=Amphimedon queenslandica TaxID=400682 RepID=A0AAN0J0U0_AMPQE|nr:PREDICTED: receptor-type tyrosine-protein phosphatase kappa-like isoform X1 [Amphimedon queenslandica]|eukprot:XP_019850659.1 PREDICTED: receptor-type tyrosine-protein phosphatase kappa-like isoform X1 [Amphimedon queenslandica]